MSKTVNLADYFNQQRPSQQEVVPVEPTPVPKENVNLNDYFNRPRPSQQEGYMPIESDDMQTVTDFESNPQMIDDYETTMDAMARNKTYTSGILDTASYSDDGPSEFMRDITFRIGTKINLATDAKDWTNSEKQAFTRLQKGWDKVSVTGMKEWKDTVVDVCY